MLEYRWARPASYFGGAIAAWIVLSLLISRLIEDSLVAWLIGFVVASNISLLLVLTNVWLVKKYPALKLALERIPGVTFAVPVPEHILSKIVVVDQPQGDELAIRRAAAKTTNSNLTLGKLVFEPPEPIQKTSIVAQHINTAGSGPVAPDPDFAYLPKIAGDRESTSSQPEPQPIDIENPSEIVTAEEPTQKIEIEHKTVKTKSIESAFRRGRKSATDINKYNQKERFQQVCRILKQENEEVTVRSDQEINALADYRLKADASDHDMIALLLPQRVVKFFSNKANNFKFHAQLFNSLLMATGKDLDVALVDSSKDLDEGQCSLSFEFNGSLMKWQFDEEDNNVSDAFLKTVMLWVGQQSQGTFVPIETPGNSTGYVFVLNQIEKKLGVN